MPYKDPLTRKLKQREYSRNHYQANIEEVKARVATRNHLTKRETREYIRVYKLEKKCAHCGYEKCVGALQFHHPDPSQKDFNVADAARSYYSLSTIQKEIDKCVVLCANCHAEEHERLLI